MGPPASKTRRFHGLTSNSTVLSTYRVYIRKYLCATVAFEMSRCQYISVVCEEGNLLVLMAQLSKASLFGCLNVFFHVYV
jgi:hypothetical protein